MLMLRRAKRIRPQGWPSMRSNRIRAALAILAGLGTGCAMTTGQPAPSTVPAPPPAATPATGAQDVPATTSVELSRTVGENTTFHPTATDRQRYQVHLDFGRVFENQGNLDRALQEYQDALTVAETKRHRGFKAADQALAHRRMAALFDRLGRFSLAGEHYQKALKLSPKDPKIWNDSGYSYYLQGRWDEAERALKTALKLAPDDARVRTNLGLTLAASGRSQEALPFLSRSEGDAVGHANLGYLLASTGQLGPARQEYGKALAMRPDLALARRALVQLDRQQRGLLDNGKQTLIAQTHARPVDPGVTPASTLATDDSALSPLPAPVPLPYPKIPSRTLP
jgi:tetratricopeptide (TPR) repeat protein